MRLRLLKLTLVSLGICFSASSLLAETIGSIEETGPNGLSQTIESLYVVLLSKGKIPVEKRTIARGDTVERILRERRSFVGGYFPVTLDALTCDLNYPLCSRPLRTVSARKGVADIASPIELVSTPGDWNRLQPGMEIILPSIQIDQSIKIIQYQKSQGQTLEEIIGNNSLCTELKDCAAKLDYLNYSNPSYKDKNYSGPIYLPVRSYLISAPDNCLLLCASFTPHLRVDLTSNRFGEAPYKILTQTPNNVQTGTSNQPSVELSPVPYGSAGQESFSGTSVTADPPKIDFPADTQKKLTIGKELIEKNGWGAIKKITKFSKRSGRQTNIVVTQAEAQDQQALSLPVLSQPAQGQQVPSQQASMMRKIGFNPDERRPRKALTRVMLIDSDFDRYHCEFNDITFIEYDCTAANGMTDSCPRFDNKSPMSEAEKAAEGAKRKICGAEGEFFIEDEHTTAEFQERVHGTHLAGIIVASNRDKFGISGINPLADIVAVRVRTDRLDGNDDYDVWLNKQLGSIILNEQVRVVNFSAGFIPTNTGREKNWLTSLIDDTPIAEFVVSAGNVDDPNCDTQPACHIAKNVTTVVGLNLAGDAPWGTASVNPDFALGATAENVIGPSPYNQYLVLSGSSQAAALVSGAVSLAISMGAGVVWSPSESKNRLIACSNILNSSLLEKMRGGMLDIDCYLSGGNDLIAKSTGEPLLGRVNAVNGGDGLKFFSTKLQRIQDLVWSDVQGFQRVGMTVVLYLRTSADPREADLERLEGRLPPGQKVDFTLPTGQQETIQVEDIQKYVRRS